MILDLNSFTCRKAIAKDLPYIYDLVRDLAIYENALDALTMDLEGYQECFENDIFESIVLEHQGVIVGTCIYYMTFSTWKGRMLYLEDFVVKQDWRNKGLGQILWNNYLRIAKEKKCALVKWQVLDWNTPAVNFYEKNGATIEKEWWNGKIIF